MVSCMTTELSQSQKNFDNLIMTQHLHKVLSAGHDYTSEDAPPLRQNPMVHHADTH